VSRTVAVASLLGLGLVGAALWWLQRGRVPGPDGSAPLRPALAADGAAPAGHVVADGATVPATTRPRAGGADAAGPGAGAIGVPEIERTAAGESALAGASWPVRALSPLSATTAAATAAAATPVVPARIAFRALWYLGTDPEAEITWRRAIDDPAHPPGVRSDLIVDMIDEGYTDNSHPTKDDLPVILARLELIERYAPYAIDRVNAEA
jgi:hypothetical protein